MNVEENVEENIKRFEPIAPNNLKAFQKHCYLQNIDILVEIPNGKNHTQKVSKVMFSKWLVVP